MKLAIIDIGSNSVRLLLATYENNEWRYEPKQLWTTRLGSILSGLYGYTKNSK